jgi:integrase
MAETDQPSTFEEEAASHLVPPIHVPAPLSRAVLALVWASLSDETWRSYQSVWKLWQRWCALMNFDPRAFEEWALALFIAANSLTHKPQTIEHHLAALQTISEFSGGDRKISTHLVRRTLRGCKRLYGTKPEQKKALLLPLLRDLLSYVDALPSKNAAIRDGALFSLMFGAALRKSDARNLDIEGIRFLNDGMTLSLRRTKTKQYGDAPAIPVGAGEFPLTDPVQRMARLLAVLPEMKAEKDGRTPVFRGLRGDQSFKAERISHRGIDYILKQYLNTLVPDPELYGTHSFRAGFVTQAKLNGLPDHLIMLVTLHDSTETLGDYTRFPSTICFGLNRQLGM